jgi:hypothetical protein
LSAPPLAQVKMSVAKLPSGVSLYYTDSGTPPAAEEYDTFVVVHGVAYNAGELLCQFY